jgi:hypothetical protein
MPFIDLSSDRFHYELDGVRGAPVLVLSNLLGTTLDMRQSCRVGGAKRNPPRYYFVVAAQGATKSVAPVQRRACTLSACAKPPLHPPLARLYPTYTESNFEIGSSQR